MKTPAISENSIEKTDCQVLSSPIWDELEEIFRSFKQADFPDELKPVFDNLHDEPLITALEKTRWTGRRGYPIKVMWRTLIAGYAFENQIPTIQGLIRTLQKNPSMAFQCGIQSAKEIPSRFAYYRFTKKLIEHTALVEKCMAETLNTINSILPDFGETVAVDSTEVPTYSNRYKKPPSDHEAKWGVKAGKNGDNHTWLGYKVHLASDVKYEIPLIPIVTPANVNDTILMLPVLKKNKALIKGFTPKYILGDKGYDAVNNYRTIVTDFEAIPIISMIMRHREKRGIGVYNDLADEYGTPYCAWGIPMVFWGYDKKQKMLKYRCPLACGKAGCTWLEKCSKSGYGYVVKIKLADDYRRFCAVPRSTERWNEYYRKRSSIERCFSILKKDGSGKLVNHKLRGLEKITLNCLLSVWVMQAKSLNQKL
ncbi:transposase [Chloroflexota bacterium]